MCCERGVPQAIASANRMELNELHQLIHCDPVLLVGLAPSARNLAR